MKYNTWAMTGLIEFDRFERKFEIVVENVQERKKILNLLT
jgi:hypothetical protein